MRSSCKIQECNVCVIGGAGFLGSHLVDHLIDDRQCNVTVVDNLTSGQRKHIHSKAVFYRADLCNSEILERVFEEYLPAFVFNYAAEPYIPECYDNPLHFFQVNAIGALHVLNACQKAGVKGLLQVSSAEIYGDMTGKIKETDPITPHSTYGVSKVAADHLVQVRWREAGVPAIAIRQFNCVGERETHDYVIPEIISQIFRLKELALQDLRRRNDQLIDRPYHVCLGNDSKRDFQYAGDAVRMAVELLEKGEFGEVYNMGSEEVVGIYDLARRIGQLMGVPGIYIDTEESRKRKWEIWHLQSDNTKLYSTIERRPEVSFVDALQRTIGYFYSNGNKWDW